MAGPELLYAAHPEPEVGQEVGQEDARAAAPKAGPKDSKAATGPSARVTHKVEPGQTLYRISRLHGVTVEALASANGIEDPTGLKVGQELVIPAPAQAQGGHASASAATPTQPGAPASAGGAAPSAPPRAHSPPPSRKEPLVMPKAPNLLEWPLRGVLYARFGSKGKERHDGIDLAAPMGTPVRVAKAGTVLFAGEQKGYGLIVIVDHGEDLITLYAHNRDLRVKTGQKVREAQVVATVGKSGRTSGPYLHFEVRRKGLPVDPLKLLGPPPREKRALGRRAR